MGETKIVVTVLGYDRIGIIAGVTGILAQANANILDISQTTMQDLFTMIMVVDISKCNIDFAKLKEKLEQAGKQLGVQITAQNEEVFKFMHRI
jgi:ACT domain-containing protein